MAGLRVVVTACDSKGNVDLVDLRAKAQQYTNELSALMVTYPSTHGVFEEDIREICAVVHEHGGQVYMDGANLNAQVALTRHALIGADVCHINLHKTFAIPHGGGGPGMGPIAVARSSRSVPPGPRGRRSPAAHQPHPRCPRHPGAVPAFFSIWSGYIRMLEGPGA